MLVERWESSDVAMMYDNRWVWSLHVDTMHSLPGFRGRLGERQRSLCTRCTEYFHRHYSFQHMLLVEVVCVCQCLKQSCMKRCLPGIVEECACVCEAGAHVTCRVTHSDTTAVWQTGQRGGVDGSMLLCVCVCEENDDEVGQLERVVKDSMGSFK